MDVTSEPGDCPPAATGGRQAIQVPVRRFAGRSNGPLVAGAADWVDRRVFRWGVTLSYGRWDSHGAKLRILVRDHGRPSSTRGASAAPIEEILTARHAEMMFTVSRLGRVRPYAAPSTRGRRPRPLAAQFKSCALLGRAGGIADGQVIGRPTNRLGRIRGKEPGPCIQESFGDTLTRIRHQPGTRKLLMDPSGPGPRAPGGKVYHRETRLIVFGR